MKNLTLAAVALVTCLLAGCTEIYTDYGQSKGLQGRKSVNGFGAMRTAYEQAGFRSRDITRLSDRVRQTDVIVWTPKALDSVDDKVTRWFDLWLRQGGRTLVYVVPDSGSEADYWIDAARIAPPDQRMEYRLRAGRCINERLQWRLNRPTIDSNGWFQIEASEKRRNLQQVEGPWEETWLPDGEQQTAAENDATIELLVVAYDPEADASASKVKATGGIRTGVTGPGSSGYARQASTSATNTSVEYSPLLSLDSESPVIGEVRSQSWQDSKIIVVAGGSLLTNYGFSRAPNRRLADRIIAESIPSGGTDGALAGFLTSDWQGIHVSERQLGTPQSSGMEMLSEWPISMVTMHGVVLGIVVCLMLLPIFGRPRRIRRSEANDFGHHLDAVAALMKRSGGETYARGRISDYLKRMHGETEGRWVLPDRPAAPPLSAVPSAASKQLPSIGDPTSKATSTPTSAPPPQSAAPSSVTPATSSQNPSPAVDPNHFEPPENQDEADL